MLNPASSRFGVVDDDIGPENRSNDEELVKMDVTLIDAFKIKEINLLIASYIFAMCHNLQILQSENYIGIGKDLDQKWLNGGSIVGVLVSGALVDLVFKRHRFLTILMLNILIAFFDIYLYTQDFTYLDLSSW